MDTGIKWIAVISIIMLMAGAAVAQGQSGDKAGGTDIGRPVRKLSLIITIQANLYSPMKGHKKSPVLIKGLKKIMRVNLPKRVMVTASRQVKLPKRR